MDAVGGNGVGRALKQIPTDPSQLAAYIFNLLSSGSTQSAATAIDQAATEGSSGATAIATAIATASAQARRCIPNMLLWHALSISLMSLH